MELKGKKIVVTGGSGFLGRVICELLREKGAEVVVPRSYDFNLVDMSQAVACMKDYSPDVVIHSAAYYGGIMINKKAPAKIFYDNLVMGANVIEASHRVGVEKFIGIGTACSYPGYIDGELKEDDLWSGEVHESVRNYGMTKKMMQIQCEAYKNQFGFNGIHLLLANLYGEWDSYTPERSHVVAALIRRFVEAKMKDQNSVTVWGSGKPIREFLYVRDAAEGIVKATESYDDVEPINIGVGKGTSIKELVNAVAKTTEFEGKIVWDSSKPDGQMVKVFNVDKMKMALDWEPSTYLSEGLNKTVAWFTENYEKAIERW